MSSQTCIVTAQPQQNIAKIEPELGVLGLRSTLTPATEISFSGKLPKKGGGYIMESYLGFLFCVRGGGAAQFGSKNSQLGVREDTFKFVCLVCLVQRSWKWRDLTKQTLIKPSQTRRWLRLNPIVMAGDNNDNKKKITNKSTQPHLLDQSIRINNL